MKYAVLCLALFSLTAFAQKKDVHEHPVKEMLEGSATPSISGQVQNNISYSYYQDGKMLSSTSVNHTAPRCMVWNAHILKNVELENLSVVKDGKKSSVLQYNGIGVASCWDVYSTDDLVNVLPIDKTRKAFAKNIPGNINIVGLTDEENQDAIINVKGSEQLISCDDLMFTDAQNGDLETGTAAFVKDLNEIVEVLAVGKKYARARYGASISDTPINKLLSLNTNPNFGQNEEVFIIKNGKKLKAKFQGEVYDANGSIYIVRTDTEILPVDKMIKIIKTN